MAATTDPLTRVSTRLFPPDKPPPWPFRARFRSRKRSERTAAILGIALGVTFGICLFTGLISHYLQQPAGWLPWPSRYGGWYRVSQGLHVVTGVATVPLLLAKLWTVAPRILQWPPFRSTAHAVERIAIAPLVAGAIFLLVSGLLNIQYWYPWKFFFPVAHFWAAILTTGALVVHVASQLPTVRRTLLLPRRNGALLHPDEVAVVERRRFLQGVGLASFAFAVLVAGTTVRPLRRVSVFAPRDPTVGPQGFPVNKSAASARVTPEMTGPAWRLRVRGNVARELSLSRSDLEAMPQTEVTLPIACVEGWSASKRWRGVRIADLLDAGGAPEDLSEVEFVSLQPSGIYKTATHLRAFVLAEDAIVALDVEGEPLVLDHGYPARLMIPNQPGVRQTKWLSEMVVR